MVLLLLMATHGQLCTSYYHDSLALVTGMADCVTSPDHCKFTWESKWNVASGIWQSDISIRHETVGSQRTWILLWNLNWPDQNHLEPWLHFTTLTGEWCEIYPKEDDQIVKLHRRFDPHPDHTLLGETRDRNQNREDPCSDAWRQIAICSNLEQL